MKPQLRVALPPLAELAADSLVPFVLFDRHARPVRSGELPLNELSGALPLRQVHAILHPGDAVVVTVDLPPVPAARLDAAVESRIEPMTLSGTQELCIAHSRRAPDGGVTVAWAARRPLESAWHLLHEAGLLVAAFVPLQLALPPTDPHPEQPLALPADARWQASLPPWSLARPQWQPASPQGRWASAAAWAGAAALLWVLGLNLYAARLSNEADMLRSDIETTVRAAFPTISVMLDPLRQTRNEVARLRPAQGLESSDDFVPLATGAAEVLGFAAGHVTALDYKEGQLTLTLAEGYTPPIDDTVLQRGAAGASLTLENDAGARHIWRVRHTEPETASKATARGGS